MKLMNLRLYYATLILSLLPVTGQDCQSLRGKRSILQNRGAEECWELFGMGEARAGCGGTRGMRARRRTDELTLRGIDHFHTMMRSEQVSQEQGFEERMTGLMMVAYLKIFWTKGGCPGEAGGYPESSQCLWNIFQSLHTASG